MRHSFGSYFLARSHDLARTAAEMGNSPDIVMNHYHALVTPEQCEAYWAMTPERFNTQDPDLEAMDRQEND
jgi:hypothetical protein